MKLDSPPLDAGTRATGLRLPVRFVLFTSLFLFGLLLLLPATLLIAAAFFLVALVQALLSLARVIAGKQPPPAPTEPLPGPHLWVREAATLQALGGDASGSAAHS
jgi:hypothetical protein